MRVLERITLVLVVIALLGASGCTKNIGATYDGFVIFPATARWAWDDALNRSPSDPALKTLNIERILREAITDGLSVRGYTLAPEGGKVDFLLHYQLGIGQNIKKSSVKSYGSLSLTMVDTRTGRSAWVGFIKVKADVTTPEDERRKRLRKNVDEMLKDFPPNQAK